MRPLLALATLISRTLSGAEVELPAGAHLEQDLAYGDDPAQRLDVYLPAGPVAGPLIVIVHGGAWALGDKARPAVVAGKIGHWLPRGFVVVSVNYRLLPQADPLEQARDVARALAFVQQRAASWGADGTRMVVIGHSTGAHLVALLAADADVLRQEGAKPWLATVLLDGAALDVVHAMQEPHRPFYDRAFGCDEGYWQEASPMHRLGLRPAPILLVHSSARRESGEQAQRFAAAVVALGGRAEVLPVALSHGEISALLGQERSFTERVDAFLLSVGVP
jgi:acetyl esterase/lipase